MSEAQAMPIIRDLAVDRCVARRDLLDAGVSPDVLLSLRRRGHLVDVFSGIYVVGLPMLTHREFLRAGVLHCGPNAWPSARSGLELREILSPQAGRATVTTRRRGITSPVWSQLPVAGRQLGHLEVVHLASASRLPLKVVDGFETPLLPRTLVDTATRQGPAVLRAAWKEAEFRCLLSPEAIQAELDLPDRRPGKRAVRERLHASFPLTRPGMDIRSRDGEVLFLSIVREAGLPEPEVNAVIVIDGRRYLVDFYWRHIGLVVEVDGPQHAFEEQSADDAVRDIDFFNHGIDLIRFKTHRLKTARGWSIDNLIRAYERQVRKAA